MKRPHFRIQFTLGAICGFVALAAMLFAFFSRPQTVVLEQISASFVDVDPHVIDDLRKVNGNGLVGAVRVHNVDKNGPAYLGGLRTGDLFLGIHGCSIADAKSIEIASASLPENDPAMGLKFFYVRHGKMRFGYLHRTP
ncbi:hypothetical protein [Stieleria mannarensis]|uniref:hypothetical protein n=1 Tax=Stieleria mannarensis TaxID=2755585 RepID=UPI0016048657|nr:hypothetical protein [Rhodopirellula sp. JC639]